jgi:hypothetical protein
MKFQIDEAPPPPEEMERERTHIRAEMKRLKRRDMIVTFIVILMFSAGASLAVYWGTNNMSWAAITGAVFPLIGAVLSLTGVVTAAGFRSQALRLIELNHELIALIPISGDNREEVQKLCKKYPKVHAYVAQVEAVPRELVNGELAMFWEWDATTSAKGDRGRAFVEKARGIVGT